MSNPVAASPLVANGGGGIPLIGPPVQRGPDPVEVEKGLLLGSFVAEMDRKELERCGVKRILTVGSGMPPHHRNAFEYLVIQVDDQANENLSKHFKECIHFIDGGRAKGETVLVHCLMGMSRSVTVVMAYLMWTLHLSVDEALAKVKSVRPVACPNIGFMRQLRDFEAHLSRGSAAANDCEEEEEHRSPASSQIEPAEGSNVIGQGPERSGLIGGNEAQIAGSRVEDGVSKREGEVEKERGEEGEGPAKAGQQASQPPPPPPPPERRVFPHQEPIKKETFMLDDLLPMPSPPLPQPFGFGYGDGTPNEIVKGLLLGSYRAAQNREELDRQGVKRVLTVGNWLKPPFPNDFEYKIIQVDDWPSVNLAQHFEDCFRFIDEAREKGDGVLVHCMMGISRSVTVVVAYLMSTENLTVKEALAKVKSLRPQASPNYGFMRQLYEFERQLGHGPQCCGPRKCNIA